MIFTHGVHVTAATHPEIARNAAICTSVATSDNKDASLTIHVAPFCMAFFFFFFLVLLLLHRNSAELNKLRSEYASLMKELSDSNGKLQQEEHQRKSLEVSYKQNVSRLEVR